MSSASYSNVSVRGRKLSLLLPALTSEDARCDIVTFTVCYMTLIISSAEPPAPATVPRPASLTLARGGALRNGTGRFSEPSPRPPCEYALRARGCVLTGSGARTHC